MRPPTRPRLALLAAVGALLAGVSAPASAAGPAPTPSTPTLPVITATVDPMLSIGGPRLASMDLTLDAASGVPAPPPLQDVAWVLADLDTGEIIAAKGAHARLRPASTLKVLTALTLIPRVSATTTYLATQADADAEGSRVGVIAGQGYTGQQLFQGLLLASGNDAAYTLARAGGGLPATLTAMNAVAADLGAHDTVAKDPSGLDVPGQTSSAYDLALIGRAALKVKDFRTYVSTRQVAFPGKAVRGAKRPTFMVQNHNKLLYNYDGTIGVKNGYTELARRTYVSAVTRGGRTLMLTEMYSLESSWRPQAAIYDWGFAHADQLTPVGQLVEPGTVTEPLRATPTTSTTTATTSTTAPVAAAATTPRAALTASDTVVTGRTALYAGGAAAGAALLVALALVGSGRGAARRGSRR